MRHSLIVTFASFCVHVVSGQNFTNLNFESAVVPGAGSAGAIALANGFPGWQAVVGGTYPSLGVTNLGLGPVFQAYYDTTDLDQMTLGIYDQFAVSTIPGASHPLVGNKTAYIEGDLGSLHTGVLELFQSGLIPSTSKSLTFRTFTYSSMGGALPQITFKLNGATLPFQLTGSIGQFTTYAADISSLANTVAEIRFSVRADYPFPNQFSPHIFVGMGLDGIAFSSNAIPEPNSISIFTTAFGFLALIMSRNRQTPNRNSP